MPAHVQDNKPAHVQSHAQDHKPAHAQTHIQDAAQHTIRTVSALALALALAFSFVLFPAMAPADDQATSVYTLESNTSADTVALAPQKNTTTANVTLNWNAAGDCNSATITATLSYKGKVMRNVSTTLSRSGSKAQETFTVDFENYGAFDVAIQFKKGSTKVGSAIQTTAKIYADSYNIAPVSATLPVTFFSLNLWGEHNIRESGPVILLMERPNAYNWDALPQGMYGLPYLSMDDLTTQPPASQAGYTFIAREQIMADYVADLLAMNPSSFINLYCADYYVDLVQRVIYANKVPEDQYHISVITDGSYTYSVFDRTYKRNNKTPEANHTDLLNEWRADKSYAYKNGTPANKYFKSDGTATYGFGYLFWAAVDSDPNAELWVARKDLLVTTGDNNAFGQKVQASAKVIQPSIASLLSENIQPSATHTAEFKALYNFNDGYFAAAQAAGKDAMVFLGGRISGEQDFVNYASFVQTYYGDTYIYYYKGHPATPTSTSATKQAQLAKLSITDVDSSIAAELILFFNPEIYLSGYASSTYASVPVGMGKGMFNMSKETGTADPLYKNMDFWMTKVSSATPEAARVLCIDGHESYLVEFSGTVAQKEGYDIAIWDATIPEIRYYKQLNDGNYRRIGGADQPLDEGIYAFQTTLANGQVLDVAGGPKVNTTSGANVQLYTYNTTPAQQWQLTYDANNYATLTCVKSGMVLEVAGGTPANKRNIRQATPTGALTQKWVLSRNIDGTLKIASAADNTFVLDATGGRAANFTNIQLLTDAGTKAQKFWPLAVFPTITTDGQANLANGYYYIRSSIDTNMALDMDNYLRTNGTNLQVWRFATSANQLLKIEKQPNGFYHIANAWSGKALDVDKGSIVPTTNVHFWNAVKTSPIQQWKITQHEDGTYKLLNIASGLVLDLQNSTAKNGNNVQVHIDRNVAAQKWKLEKVDNPTTTLDTLAATNKNTLPNGTYTIVNANNTNMAVDVAGGMLANTVDVRLWERNNTPAQQWKVTHDAQGYVIFTCIKSNKALDVAGGVPRLGTNVWQYTSNNTRAQKWIVVPQQDGTYEIVSALYPNLSLDIAGGRLTNGSAIQLYASNGTAAQRFKFAKAA